MMNVDQGRVAAESHAGPNWLFLYNLHFAAGDGIV